uniref:Cysteine protease n=1 Tax=Alexandrium andersonii TaxID=327968 RepID=A0A7S2MBY8_9DINO
MARSVALLFAALAAGGSVASDADISTDAIAQEFENFIKAYRKDYSPEERKARFAAFEANFRFVHSENFKGRTFELGLNEHADMSNAEFMNMRLGLSRPNGTKPWGDLQHLGTMVASGATLPSSVDWRKRGALTPVQNQGHCGACWTFSATGALSAAWQIQTGILAELSEQQLLDCTGGSTQGCKGGSMDAVFSYARRVGLCTADSYQYVAHQETCRSTSSCAVAIPQGSVLGYRDVRPDSELSLMEAVAQQPVSVGIEAQGMSFQFYKAGVYSNTCGDSPNHAVLLVGYGTEQSTGQRYWLLKNSWGPAWGESGYFKLLREASGSGQCGVMTMPSYPVVRGRHQGPTQSPPTSTPSTTRAPSAGQMYGRPPCLRKEVLGRVSGGVVCTPRCNGWGECPGSPAPGVLAQPRCVLKDTSFWGQLMGIKYCALVCHSTSECAAGARCVGSGKTGVCVYPDSDETVRQVGAANNATTLSAEDPRRLSEATSATNGVFV